VLTNHAPDVWRVEINQLVTQGAPLSNEVAFVRHATRTLILIDLVFNVAYEKRDKSSLFWWLVGAAGRFGPHRIVRIGIRDRRTMRRSIDQILAWNFDRVKRSW
jgi:hypothetical protein